MCRRLDGKDVCQNVKRYLGDGCGGSAEKSELEKKRDGVRIGVITLINLTFFSVEVTTTRQLFHGASEYSPREVRHGRSVESQISRTRRVRRTCGSDPINTDRSFLRRTTLRPVAARRRSRTRPHNLNGSSSSMISWSPCSTRSLSPCGSPLSLKGSWAYDVVYLPTNLERSIKIIKGALPLGVTLDAETDKGVNGCVVRSICSKKAIGKDGRIQNGDYVVKVNNETLRNVTGSQARAILKRTNLIGTQINITYITAADAKLWKQRFHRDKEPQSPVINRLSPKVFPKFYKSPFMGRKEGALKSI
ncbi:hypothetical protein L596_000247 [Steinernema carpocapsae]|uniref:PDZ domain-containing protein n=1 Tax=Steinernema carpocapsae TaxID=34508 RepID=A0A4U8UK08_STECR|nr:hypothetical protein L596_000247 [Steinernema carpocapsae]